MAKKNIIGVRGRVGDRAAAAAFLLTKPLIASSI